MVPQIDGTCYGYIVLYYVPLFCVTGYWSSSKDAVGTFSVKMNGRFLIVYLEGVEAYIEPVRPGVEPETFIAVTREWTYTAAMVFQPTFIHYHNEYATYKY